MTYDSLPLVNGEDNMFLGGDDPFPETEMLNTTSVEKLVPCFCPGCGWEGNGIPDTECLQEECVGELVES